MLLSSDAKMSALVVCRNGIACLSGDSHGAMKLWDLRTRACVETLFNEEGHKPITSLTTSAPPDGISLFMPQFTPLAVLLWHSHCRMPFFVFIKMT
jgi:WD40 repeat protein